jgi:hypothetical protein
VNPFARLGLSEDADRAQIKRAYARELRLARPDEDPQAFQQLHEAYVRCLELAAPEDAADFSHADMPAAAFDDISLQFDAPALQPLDAIDPQWPAALPSTLWRYSHRSEPHEAPRWPASAIDIALTPPEDEAAFDLDQFTRELFRYQARHSPGQLDAWLRAHPALYNLERKEAVGQHVLEFLCDGPTLYMHPLEVILRFFELDGLHPGRPWMHAAVDELRERARSTGTDFSELRFAQPDPRRSSEEPPWMWLLVLLFVCMTVMRAFKGFNSSL